MRKTEFLGGSIAHPFGMEIPGRTYKPGEYRYGFGGHEKIDEISGSGNWYDFGDYGYDPQTGRRKGLDPVDQISISNYVVFSNNPINRIDTDGRDDYKLNKNGDIEFVKQTKSENHTIYAVNSKGKIDKGNSIEIGKDFISSKITNSIKSIDSNGNISPVDVDVYTTFGDDKSTRMFEFMSDNSDVEWSHIKASVYGIAGYEEVNYIGTSKSYGNDASQSYIAGDIVRGNVTIREANHSHPNNNKVVSFGDVEVATSIQNRFPDAKFNNYCPGNEIKYTPYDMYSVPGLLEDLIITPE